MLKSHSILRNSESSEIKQVSSHTIPSLLGGINKWSTFFLKVEHFYIVKVREIPGYGLTHLPLQATNCNSKPNWMFIKKFSFSAANFSRKWHKKHPIGAAEHGFRQFHLHHQIVECTWACPTSLDDLIDVHFWAKLLDTCSRFMVSYVLLNSARTACKVNTRSYCSRKITLRLGLPVP